MTEPPPLEALFHAARSLPAGPEREAHLDAACGGDVDLRRQVELLLGIDARAVEELDGNEATRSTPGADPRAAEAARDAVAGDLDRYKRLQHGPPASVLQTLQERTGAALDLHLHATEPEDPPVKVTEEARRLRDPSGRYQVLGEIARGGVGIVYKGRDQDLGRDVAMKVLQDQFAENPGVLSRFVEEAQIGGQLQHPGIVPVYELGLQAGERPYFAMKLVRGETLATQFARRQDPAQDRRRLLGAFEQICQAMAYAHTRRVVHRDLKPGNVMLGSFGEVQVVDWGLAKVLPAGPPVEEASSSAAEQPAVPTLIETVRSRPGSGSANTVTGSLMGTPGYMPPEQARGEMERVDQRSDVFGLGAILCELLTGAPPYRKQDGDQMQQAANALLAPARARLARCGADKALVALCEACLAPARLARPATAGAVAEVVSAYLTSVEERARTARHRQRSALALSLVLLVGVAGTTFGMLRAIDQKERAEIAESLTQRQLERATEIKQLITGMLSSVTPEQAGREDTVLLRQILEDTSARLAAGEVKDELVAAELHAVVGDVYNKLGLFDAETHLSQVWEIRARLLGPDDPQTLAAMHQLARMLSNWPQVDQDETDALWGAVVEARRRVLGEEHADTLRSLICQYWRDMGLRRSDEAEQRGVDLLESARTVLGPEDPDTLAVMHCLAVYYFDQRRLVEAHSQIEDALAGRRHALGEDHPSTLDTLLLAAQIFGAEGHDVDAERFAREAAETAIQIFEAGSPQRGRTVFPYLVILANMGRYAEAEAVLLPELANAADNPEYHLVLSSWLGGLLQAQGRSAEAREILERSLPVSRMNGAQMRVNTQKILRSLSLAYEQLGQLEEERSLRREWQTSQLAEAAAPSVTSRTLLETAESLLAPHIPELHDPQRAREFADAAVAMEAAEGRSPWWLFEVLARAQQQCGDASAALATAQRGLALVPKEAGEIVRTRLRERIQECSEMTPK